MIRVAINGFGRIGRMVFRAGFADKKIKFVAVNDLVPAEQLAYLLKHDSIQGKWEHEVKIRKNMLVVDGKEIIVLNEKEPAQLPWKELRIDVVVESTGIFLTEELASKHLEAGTRKVLLSAPAKDESISTYVYGVNHKSYKGERIISNASCTTNCVAPITKVLLKEFGIRRGFFTTAHAYTADQNLVDGPHKKDVRRGRAAGINIVPTTTGAHKAVAKVLPALQGKLSGIALRVPVATASITDFVYELETRAKAQEINEAIARASRRGMKGIIEYSQEPLVSSDIIGNSHSAIFDSLETQTIDRLAKMLAWYDNEYGYACRMIDMIKVMSK